MNYCTNCGAQLPENADQCPVCGAMQAPKRSAFMPNVNDPYQNQQGQSMQQNPFMPNDNQQTTGNYNGESNQNTSDNSMMNQNPFMPTNVDNTYAPSNETTNQDFLSGFSSETTNDTNSFMDEAVQTPNMSENPFVQAPTQEENYFSGEQTTPNYQNNQFQQPDNYGQQFDQSYQQTQYQNQNQYQYDNSLNSPRRKQNDGLVFMIIGWVCAALSLIAGWLWMPLAFLLAGAAAVMGYLYRDHDKKHGTIIMLVAPYAAFAGVFIAISINIMRMGSTISSLF